MTQKIRLSVRIHRMGTGFGEYLEDVLTNLSYASGTHWWISWEQGQPILRSLLVDIAFEEADNIVDGSALFYIRDENGARIEDMSLSFAGMCRWIRATFPEEIAKRRILPLTDPHYPRPIAPSTVSL